MAEEETNQETPNGEPKAEPQAESKSEPPAQPKTETQPAPQGQPQQQNRGPQQQNRPPRQDRPERQDRPDQRREQGDRPRGDRRDDRPGGRPGGGGPRDRDRRPDMAPDIELEKLISDSLYLDNQAHAIVNRLRDMDSGTKSQLRRLYNAVRRACRAGEGDRQHEFVMLRARLAYTIARHSLRSLDTLEKLLLQVTRKNEVKGYERFRDLFEAIVAYNE
jgi:CRISPR type III-A-associated protein Csm2